MRPLGRLALLVAVLAAASPLRAQETGFTDDAGRVVTVTRPVGRILPAGPPADALLFALAPQTLPGLVEPFRTEQRPVVPAPWRDLPIVPRLTPDPLKSDLTTIRGLRLDLVVDYGDVTPKYTGLADRVTEATGVPAVLLDGRLAETPRVLRRLAGLVDRAAEGEDLARRAEEVLARLRPLAGLAAAERVPVYLARGWDGLDAIAAGTILDEAVAAAGGRNVVAREGGGYFRTLKPEAVAALAPKVVIVEHAEAVADDAPLRRALPAETVFLVDDHRGFHWVENPPSVNRLIGAAWLAGRLHPGRTTIDEAFVDDLARRILHVTEP